jgi:5-methylcytosine-specific restriction endonuclease McrBC GTP-binding regulatory subunit McrB
MESKEPVSLYSGNERKDENGRVIPQSIVLPSNLFIVGTVNIDETTYMFSPKVLDRANTIEFKVDVDDMKEFFGAEISVSGEEINGKGVGFSSELMGWFSKEHQQGKDRSSQLMSFFRELQGVGAEFGYRTAGEMVELMNRLDGLGMDAARMEDALDVAVMQKLLPKLHGSRSKLSKVIPILISLCIDAKEQANQDLIKKLLDDYRQQKSFVEDKKGMIKLKLSITKLSRMHTNAIENGFASFAEG